MVSARILADIQGGEMRLSAAGPLRLPGFGDLPAVQAEEVSVHRFGQARVKRLELQPQMMQAMRPLYLSQHRGGQFDLVAEPRGRLHDDDAGRAW